MTPSGPVLVLGATGTTGRRVGAALRTAGAGVRPASRSSPTRFDWTAAETWEPALDGVGAVYLMAPDGVAVDERFVRLAVASGVRRIVLLSSDAVEEMGDARLLDAERAVRESGAEWTVLRPSWFDQDFDEGVFRDAVLAGELALPLGDLRQAFVDADDIAAVAAAALTTDGHAGQTYQVQGPRALSFAEALALVSRASGRPVRFAGDPAEYRAAHLGYGRDEAEVDAELAAFAALRARGDDEPGDAVRRVTGRDPRSFEDHVRAAAERGAWRG
ncbi:NAD(P)H-binding protein [Geodermatophilus sp. CPCC 206100]|uniref:NAD(P)H-binding protein n=1 Tax=Geodermatophilus sp. CPCC 206100 TaxID=3020054 RepID=UPI003B00ADEB